MDNKLKKYALLNIFMQLDELEQHTTDRIHISLVKCLIQSAIKQK